MIDPERLEALEQAALNACERVQMGYVGHVKTRGEDIRDAISEANSEASGES
jgi:hypothetical protein